MKRWHIVPAALCTVAALVATSLPATAGKAKTIIEDPLGDSNFLNDQGTGDGSFGDFNQAGAGNVSDLLQVQVSNDAKNLTITFQAQGVPPATQGLGYRLRVNPTGAPGSQCLLFEAFWPGATNVMTEPVAHVIDNCEGGEAISVKLLGGTLVVPRKSTPALGKGAVLKAPQAQTFVYSGNYPTGIIGPYMDTTKVGSDYKLVG